MPKFEKGHPKFGGRTKGTTNKLTRDVQEFVDEVFNRVNPFDKLEELLAGESEQVRAGVLDRLMQYRFGKPKETIDVTGTISLRDALNEARKRSGEGE